jgi:hypothetical protein
VRGAGQAVAAPAPVVAAPTAAGGNQAADDGQHGDRRDRDLHDGRGGSSREQASGGGLKVALDFGRAAAAPDTRKVALDYGRRAAVEVDKVALEWAAGGGGGQPPPVAGVARTAAAAGGGEPRVAD